MHDYVELELVAAAVGGGPGQDPVGSRRTMAGVFLIPDEMWEQIEPLIPVHVNHHPLGGGRPRVPDRQMDRLVVAVDRWIDGKSPLEEAVRRERTRPIAASSESSAA